MTRLYYTCPIQAMYMAKEYGIEFECKYTPEEMIENEEPEQFYSFEHSTLDGAVMIGDLSFENFRKIYVKKEFEQFFNKKVEIDKPFFVPKLDEL